MKQYFVKHNDNKSLILFFSGWGMDENTLCIVQKDYDTSICFDYTDMTFEKSQYENYEVIDVYGWSMGVWAASYVLQNCDLPIRKRIAINGTIFPIEAQKGINPTIFQKTIDSLSEQSLLKFNKRMCGDKIGFELFENNASHRSIESLKSELISIQLNIRKSSVPTFHWDKAIIGSRDLIFQPENQKKAWENTKYEIVDEAHFLDFNKYVDR